MGHVYSLSKNRSHEDNEIINEWNLSYQSYVLKMHGSKK